MIYGYTYIEILKELINIIMFYLIHMLTIITILAAITAITNNKSWLRSTYNNIKKICLRYKIY